VLRFICRKPFATITLAFRDAAESIPSRTSVSTLKTTLSPALERGSSTEKKDIEMMKNQIIYPISIVINIYSSLFLNSLRSIGQN